MPYLTLRPRPHWESLQRSLRPPSWIQEILLSKGMERIKEKEGKGKEKAVDLAPNPPDKT